MKKVKILLLAIFSILLFPCFTYAADTGPRTTIKINIDEDGDTQSSYGETWQGDDIDNLDDYFSYEDQTLTLMQPDVRYVVESRDYELNIDQTTQDEIFLTVWADSDLALNHINTKDGSNITANGDLAINNSIIHISGFNDWTKGSVNAEGDITIDDSHVTCLNDSSNDDSFNTFYGNIHSYYGDIYIKNHSAVIVEGRIYIDDGGSIHIDDSNVTLDGTWGYMNSTEDIDIINSKVSFLFGIEASENIKIISSEVTAIDTESAYAKIENQGNQGWIQASNGAMTIHNSKVHVVNSITSMGDMSIKDSSVAASGKYSNNGYLQSGDGSLNINHSEIFTDKDVWAKNDLTITNSNVAASGANSQKGYIEANTGKLSIQSSIIKADEGLVAHQDSIFADSDIAISGEHSGRGYVQVHDGALSLDHAKLEAHEKLTTAGRLTIANQSSANLRSGIVSNGIDLSESSLYASNHDTSQNLSSYSPIISLSEVTIKDSEFIAESINDLPSILSLGNIIPIDNSFKNQNNNLLDVISITSDANTITSDNTEYIPLNQTVYTTALNGAISPYTTLTTSTAPDNIDNPATNDSLTAFAPLLALSLGAGLALTLASKKSTRR